MQDNYDPLAVPPSDWEGGNFEKEFPSIGEHQAVCCQIHNLGYQEYQGNVSPSPKVALLFELDEKMKDGKLAGNPFVLSVQFNRFMGPDSKMRTFLENWRGRPFTPDAANNFTLRPLISKGCTLLVNHEKKKNGDTKAVIVGISPPKGPALPVTYTEAPKWIAETQAKQVQPKPNKRAMASAGGPPPQGEDDLPF